jgi:hypothetical protein
VSESHPHDCMLTLACPASLEEEMIDQLRSQPEWVGGFSILAAEGFGVGTRHHTAMERVRGRSRRRMFLLLMRRQHVALLVEFLRNVFPSEEIAWWTAPVDGFGRLA